MLNFMSIASCSIVLLAPLMLEAVALGQPPNVSSEHSLPVTSAAESRIVPLVFEGGYLYRMAAALIGIYGNDKEEAIYPVYFVDRDKQKLDGSNRYRLRFAKGQLPPVNSFWSLTMYDQPTSLLVHNPINRCLLNSTMLPEFKYDEDGGVTLFIQNESPGKDQEANWLPAPQGPFSMVLRLYGPKAEALDGTWNQPPLLRLK